MTNVEVSPNMQIFVEENPNYAPLLQAYISDSDVFLKQRGFEDAVGKLTYFRLNKGNLEVHVEGLGSAGYPALPSDAPIVAEFASRHDHLELIRRAMHEHILRQANALRAKFEAELSHAVATAQSSLKSL